MRTFIQKPKATQQTTLSKSTTPSRSFVGQSRDVHSILHLQRTIGNQAALRLLQTAPENSNASSASNISTGCSHDVTHTPLYPSTYNNIQLKLKVSTPKDQYEQEAERITGDLMRTPNSYAKVFSSTKGDYPRYNKNKTGLKQSPMITNSSDLPSPVQAVVSSLGQPLQPAIRSSMEQRFGQDLGQVSIHTDTKAAESAAALHAKAFTAGKHIGFASGEFNPHTPSGQRLLIHELSHVVQQQQHSMESGPKVFLYPADEPYQESVSFDRINRREEIHQGIVVHIPRAINGEVMGPATAVACIQAALRMDVERGRADDLAPNSAALRSAIQNNMERQASQDPFDITIHYTRQPEQGNRVDAIQIEDIAPEPVSETSEVEEELSHNQMVECLIADYRARSASDFEAWDLAREDYRLISTSGGDAMLRDAEHYLFRYYLATQLDDVVWIPDGLPFNIPSEYNPPIPMNAFVMQYWHDPLYNELVRPVLEQFMDVAPTTESMTEWEERGWHDGFCAVGQCDFREAYEEHRDQRNEYYSDPAVISGIGGP